MEAAAAHIKKYPKECVPFPYLQLSPALSYSLEILYTESGCL